MPRSSRNSRLLVLAVAVSALCLPGCAGGPDNPIIGSGHRGTERRDFAPFSKILAEGNFDIELSPNRKFIAAIEIDANVIGYVDTWVESDTLHIRLGRHIRTTKPVRLRISSPRLESLTLTGNGDLRAIELDQPALAVHLKGSGKAKLIGKVSQLMVDVAGPATVQAGSLEAESATVRLAGPGTVTVKPARLLTAAVSGTGTIAYVGNPTEVRKEVGGTGEIKQIDPP